MSNYESRFSDEFDALDRKYRAVEKIISNMLTGNSTTPLILEGPAGVGKTSMVKKFIVDSGHTRYDVVAGKITPLALYIALYELRNTGDILILDDTDTALENIDALNILKAATDTQAERVVSWISSKAVVGLPQQFKTKGSIIILSNNTFANSGRSKKGAHLDAIMSRSYSLTISDTNIQNKFIQLCYMVCRNGMFNDLTQQESNMLLQYIEDNLQVFKQFDLRTAVKLRELYKLHPEDWRDTAEFML